jgi:hypothetical protein
MEMCYLVTEEEEEEEEGAGKRGERRGSFKPKEQ